LTHVLAEAPLYRKSVMTQVRPVYEGARKWAEGALEDWVAKARGIDRALLGSVADRVVRLAPCPVLTVREPA